MRRCQTSRQQWVSQQQAHLNGFFQCKAQKPHLPILGSLMFCMGLALVKPAWSASNVSAKLPQLSNTDQSIKVIADSTEVNTIPSDPEILSPEVAQEWSQPVGRDGINILEPRDIEKEEIGIHKEVEDGETSPDNPVASSQNPSVLIPDKDIQILNPQSPNLLTEAENIPISQLQPSPIPKERSSESQQPESSADPELGNLRLRELAAPSSPSKPAVYLLGGVGYFRSNNIFSGIDPVDDDLFKAGVTLLAAPSLGPKTSLFASVGGDIYRYNKLSEYDYDELTFNAGIRQQIGSRTYGELGWSNRQLFSHDSGDRFLNDHSVHLELGRRDFLTQKLKLDTFYQLRVSFANPSDRSQVINYVGASLGYNPIPPLEVALDYQFAFAEFTQQERQDQYHQLLGRLTYTLSPNSRLYLYGGQSLGHSSDEFTNFDGLVFGAGVNLGVTLF